MNSFPVLPMLEEIKKNSKIHFDHDYYIISVQHLMSTTGSLFEAIVSFGVKPDHIFLTGKIYSTHEITKTKLGDLGIRIFESTFPEKPGTYSECLEKDVMFMWNSLRKVLNSRSKIIILDDGGFMLRNIPDDLVKSNKIVGIEQTTSGIKMQSAFEKIPVISVATSQIKLTLEPPIVAESVKLKLGKIIRDLNPQSVGIAGFGHVGKAVAEMLSEKYKTFVYDPKCRNENHPDISFCRSIQELVILSDIVIGATGEDISDPAWLENSEADKTFISISSGDIEFNRLLKTSEKFMIGPYTDPLGTISLRTKNGHLLKILRGGMVANFTGEENSGPPEMIQVTRALLLRAVLQANELIGKKEWRIGIVGLRK